MDAPVNDFKNKYRPEIVTTYINKVGNRISDAKFDLYKETFEKFPKFAEMLSESSECELLKMLVKVSNTKRAIEIGTFTGYSALCIAEALPEDGKLLCFDVSEEFTNIARDHWKKNKVDHKIELSLEDGAIFKLLNDESNLNSFDFAYVDADKPGYPKYYEALLKLLKPNGFIVFDNMLFSYQTPNDNPKTENAKALRGLALQLQTDERVDINMLDISDGISIVRKR